jgi:beta-galactosidase
MLSSLQAVAHGSDTVQYFQWRKSRGASEKFHGAVVDHCGHEHTRVFREVTTLGNTLEKLNEVLGSTVEAETAIIFDWENRWALNDAEGPRNKGINYEETILQHYNPFWQLGVPVDIIGMEDDFSKYKLLIAPMLYMVKAGVGERIEDFVTNGGTFVATYWSGIVDENDLCYLGGFPGPLRKVLGIWSEEIDSLHEQDINGIDFEDGNSLELMGQYDAIELCDLIHIEKAESLAVYRQDFYQGRPALTLNMFGRGKAYYLATRVKEPFYDDLYSKLVMNTNIRRAINTPLPRGVTAQVRTDGESDYVFILNFSEKEQEITMDDLQYKNILSGDSVPKKIPIEVNGVLILKRLRA